MKTFLFQGDSVTDAGRSYNDDTALGSGYPLLMSAELLHKYPGQFSFLNRAVSGNRVVDVYARIKKDIINIQPDYISFLIGINDVWHELLEMNGVSAIKFEMLYSMLIEEVCEALPDVKIILLEPFVLNGKATSQSWGYFKEEVALRSAAVQHLAEKYDLTYIPLQQKFSEAAEATGSSYWLIDGVHPTAAGHALIKEALCEAFLKQI